MAGGRGSCLRALRGPGADASDVFPPVWGETGRSGYVWHGVRRSGRDGGARQLLALAPRGCGEPGRGLTSRVDSSLRVESPVTGRYYILPWMDVVARIHRSSVAGEPDGSGRIADSATHPPQEPVIRRSAIPVSSSCFRKVSKTQSWCAASFGMRTRNSSATFSPA